MENENAIVKRDQQSFIERLVEKAGSLNDIKQVGEVIIASGFCPDHFKQSKDSVGVIMCIEAGKQLGMSWMQALSDLYPVKGRIGMMGDAAVALVQGSGLCEYWKESTEGTFPNRDYKHIIISKRKGYPNENKTEFSVFDAESAGLMTKDIYKRYGKRMIRYRCVGFHTRDFYSDVLKGMKTVEELQDYDANLLSQQPETKLLTKEGKEIKIPGDKAEQSEKIAQSVSSHIEKANSKLSKEEVQEIVAEAEQITPVVEEAKQEWTENSLTEMGNRIYEFAEKVLPAAKFKMLESIPGKKSNKRFREALLAFQEGTIDKWLTDALKSNMGEAEPPQTQTADPEEKVAPEKKEEVISDDLPWENRGSQNQITTAEATKMFESERATPIQQESEESTEIPVVSALGANGKRSFPDAIKLTNFFKTTLGVTDANINDQIKGTGLQFPSLGNFCERAEKDIIEIVIQKNL